MKIEKRRPMVAGNWKMNGPKNLARELISRHQRASFSLQKLDVVIFPPSILISCVLKDIRGSDIHVGGQNLGIAPSGAFTGEISGSMLKDQDCNFVIVGHSERRQLFGEDDSIVGQKAQLAFDCGLKPVICVGETLDERESGRTMSVVERQIRAVLDTAGMDIFPESLIAYEPVWAIGTGKTAKPEEAQEIHSFLRDILDNEQKGLGSLTRILYGGSVNVDNASKIFNEKDIDGGLIGGASLDADDFISICEVASKLCL